MSLPFGLEETVRAIVRDELAAQRPAGGADGMSLDGGQQLAPDGSITYDFAGHVHAQGVDLDSSRLGTPLDANRVRWTDVLLDVVTATLYGRTIPDINGNPVGAELDLRSEAAAPLGSGRVFTRATAPGNLSTTIEVFASDALYQILASAGPVLGQLLLDHTGKSDWLQLAATEQLALEILDTGTYAINGGAAVGAGGTWTDTYNHALGRVPQFAAAILANGGTVGTNVLVERLATRTTTQLGFAYRFVNGASSAAGATARFLILVIG